MASISRFGRAISSGKSASDNSFPSRVSVSSAVWSNRFAKSESAVPVVIKNSSQSSWPDNRLWHRLRQFRPPGSRRLKTAGKSGKFQPDMPAIYPPARAAHSIFRPSGIRFSVKKCSTLITWRVFCWQNRYPLLRNTRTTRNINFAHCPQTVPHPAAGAVAAISLGTAVSRRPSGLDADGLALYDRRTGVTAMDRFQRHLAFAAAVGGCRRGREILQPSRYRLVRVARCDRRRGGRRGGARRLDHHPAGGEKPVPVAEPQRDPQGAGISARTVDRSGAAEAAHPGDLSQHRRAWAIRPVRRAGRRDLCLLPPGIGAGAARSSAIGGDPSQSAQARRPQSPPRGAPSGRDLHGPGAGLRTAAMLERKSRFLSRFWGILAGRYPSFE